MFKLFVLSALVACAFAAPSLPTLLEPVRAAPAVAVPLATSYHNTYRAPVIKAAPVLAAAPVVAAPVAPVAVAHAAPVIVKSHPIAAPIAVAHAVPVVKTPIAAAPLLVKPALIH